MTPHRCETQSTQVVRRNLVRLKSQPSGTISNKAENRDNQNFPVSKRLTHHLSVAEGTSQMLVASLNSSERIKRISWKSFNTRASTRTEWPGSPSVWLRHTTPKCCALCSHSLPGQDTRRSEVTVTSFRWGPDQDHRFCGILEIEHGCEDSNYKLLSNMSLRKVTGHTILGVMDARNHVMTLRGCWRIVRLLMDRNWGSERWNFPGQGS